MHASTRRSDYEIAENFKVYDSDWRARYCARFSWCGPALQLLAQAQRAATSKDMRARVTPAGEASRSVSLWDESRIWDPGD